MESHLAYADDITLFCIASKKSFKTSKLILDDFYLFSSLHISPTNSFIVFSTRVHDGEALASIIRLRLVGLPFIYLGVSVTKKLISHQYYASLVIVTKSPLKMVKWSAIL